ncbi:A24 family peptidase [Roseomonas sp. NAR14]|uniref:A24 family peptidase n=1 Tax=Roseomonas acroporae TaxID=2937791 RepID=A0A9X1YAC8_9PROT|nr:A24 family peptidase [Roseomonas acroporae]MCK8785753.1 A24 family peptidase [Roseomonas acroporae]
MLAGIPVLATLVSVPLLVAAALNDLATRLLPDRAALLLALLGGAARAAEGPVPFLWSLPAPALVLGAGVLFWWRGWIGGGDVKLLPAATLLVPTAEVPALLLAIASAGGGMALLYLLLARCLQGEPPPLAGRGASLARRLRAVERRRLRRGGPLPYGVAIAAGTIACALSHLVPGGGKP